MIIAELLKQGSEFLDTLDREVVLSHVLGVEREHLIAHNDEVVSEEAFIKLYQDYLARVKDGEPVAYVTGVKEFYGMEFFVDKRVLVPRPETEELVDKALEYLNELERGARVLDVGTGSGNMAVAIAKNCEGAGVLALDISEGACEVARLNAESHGVDDRVEVVQSDLLEVIDEGSEFDVIVANLPYIGEEKNRFVSDAAVRHEPNVALFGGSDGLELYKKMFQQLASVKFGVLMGEFGFAQREDMETLLNKYFEQDWRIEKDLAGIDRTFYVRKT